MDPETQKEKTTIDKTCFEQDKKAPPGRLLPAGLVVLEESFKSEQRSC